MNNLFLGDLGGISGGGGGGDFTFKIRLTFYWQCDSLWFGDCLFGERQWFGDSPFGCLDLDILQLMLYTIFSTYGWSVIMFSVCLYMDHCQEIWL